jgi:hypothetical protein
MSLLHVESFPAYQAGWILSDSLDQFFGRGSPPKLFFGNKVIAPAGDSEKSHSLGDFLVVRTTLKATRKNIHRPSKASQGLAEF